MPETRKVAIFIIHYSTPEDRAKISKVLGNGDPKGVTAQLNSIGEITNPYTGEEKRIEGLIDDLILASPTTAEPIKESIRSYRCAAVQKLLKEINSSTDPDTAYAIKDHVPHCHICQDFVMKMGMGGNKDVEEYIAKKLQEPTK